MWPFSRPRSKSSTGSGADVALNPFTEVQILEAHQDIVHVLQCTSGADAVISGDDAGSIHAWNCREARLKTSFTGHTRKITATCVLNGNTLVSAASDRTVRFWDYHSGDCLTVIDNLTASVKAILSLGHNVVACVSDVITLYSHRGVLLHTITRPDGCCEDYTTALPIRGGRLIAVSVDTVELLAWEKSLNQLDADKSLDSSLEVDTKTENLTREHALPGAIMAVASLHAGAFGTALSSGRVVLWSTHANVAPYRTLKLPTSAETVDGMSRRAREDDGDRMPNYAIGALHAIGSSLLAVAVSRSIYLFDVGTGSVITEVIEAHAASIYHLATMASGRILITGGEDSMIYLWSLAHYYPTGQDGTSPSEAAEALLRSELMTASVNTGVTTTVTGLDRRKPPRPLCIGVLAGHSRSITGLVVRSNHMLVSSSSDGTIHVWKNGAWKWRYANLITAHMLEKEPVAEHR